MKAKPDNHAIHLIFLLIVFLFSVTGFWNIYFGADANPTVYHHLHVVTTFSWLIVLLVQLRYISGKKYHQHKKIGAFIFVLGPLVIATLILLSVHSASKAAARGEADPLVIQNIFPALEVGILILLGFLFRKNRKLHGHLLLSSTLLFLGIAMFFTLISFVPQYKIEGPETFYRFESAAIIATTICVALGLLLFFMQWRSGWPWLLVSALFFVNAFTTNLIAEAEQTKLLTAFIGSINEYAAFFMTFTVFLLMLYLSFKLNIPDGKRFRIGLRLKHKN
ncbi:hypothetical protein WJR50_28550 [Catalinimonas sp. 4WD22]|uniref:hypothetical protein n=1 Tax=Catalinimonas locisalis TaxID=3133978 RepID=UPI003101484A